MSKYACFNYLFFFLHLRGYHEVILVNSLGTIQLSIKLKPYA